MLQPHWGWISHTQVIRGRSAGTRHNPGLKDGIPLGFETNQPTSIHAPAKVCIERGDSVLGGLRRGFGDRAIEADDQVEEQRSVHGLEWS